MTATRTRIDGQDAERRALEHLRTQGLTLVTQNWSCRRGELDLVMLDGDTVVFVEVRYRKHSAWGGAMESIDARKRQKIILAAQTFLQNQKRLANRPCRFDVIALSTTGHLSSGLEWIKSAFDA